MVNIPNISVGLKQSHVPFYTSLFISLFFSFVFFTIIGTLSHEAGHLLVSKLFGFQGGAIHYGSTSYGRSAASDSLIHYYKERVLYKKIYHGDFPEEELIQRLEKPARIRHLWMAWGGPFQTMLTGTVGMLTLILIKKRKHNQLTTLQLSEWLWVFFALFWLRQLANCFGMFMLLVFKGKYGHGDEAYLSEQYNLPPWALNVITGSIGLYILYYVVFKFIPPQQRFTFLLAGLVGGISGYILWLRILGPVILP